MGRIFLASVKHISVIVDSSTAAALSSGRGEGLTAQGARLADVRPPALEDPRIPIVPSQVRGVFEVCKGGRDAPSPAVDDGYELVELGSACSSAEPTSVSRTTASWRRVSSWSSRETPC